VGARPHRSVAQNLSKRGHLGGILQEPLELLHRSCHDHAVRWIARALKRPSAPSEAELLALVTKFGTRLDAVEDQIQHERMERKNLLADVEEHLDRVTKRYARARAAESRAESKDKGELGNGDPEPMSDDARRLAILRSRPSPWGG